MHRAYVVRQHGPPSSHAVESIPTPVPEGNEVLVSVKAAGVNFPDSLIIRGKYQFQPQFPYSPGGEFSGVVDAVGPDVSTFASGDRVVGMSIHGSYSEKLITDESKLAKLPQSMDFATGAVVQLAHGTMLHALKDVAKLGPSREIKSSCCRCKGPAKSKAVVANARTPRSRESTDPYGAGSPYGNS